MKLFPMGIFIFIICKFFGERMKKVFAKLWPKNTLPGVRKAFAFVYRQVLATKSKLEFKIWKTFSLLKYGNVRKIKIYSKYEIYINNNDYRGFIVSKSKGTQREKINVWKEMAKFHPDICIDIGANYGEFSIVTTSMGLNSLAVEINPIPVECLKLTFQNFKNMKVEVAAASNFDGEKSFFFNPTATGSGSFSKNVPDKEIELYNVGGGTKELSVPCKKLDTLIKESGKNPNSFIMKLDVEGHEDAVLGGMSELLHSVKWWRGLMEFSPSAILQSGKSPQIVWNLLKTFNGYILENNVYTDLNLETKLPDVAPQEDCEIIIGRGKAN
jgi:FkbM family methyltransferase